MAGGWGKENVLRVTCGLLPLRQRLQKLSYRLILPYHGRKLVVRIDADLRAAPLSPPPQLLPPPSLVCGMRLCPPASLPWVHAVGACQMTRTRALFDLQGLGGATGGLGHGGSLEYRFHCIEVAVAQLLLGFDARSRIYDLGAGVLL